MVEELELCRDEQAEATLVEEAHTVVPDVIGTWISNTMTLAVNTVTRGTRSLGGHKTLPTRTFTGSIDVSASVTLAPDIAQGTCSSSSSMAVTRS